MRAAVSASIGILTAFAFGSPPFHTVQQDHYRSNVVSSLVFSPTGDRLYIGCEDGYIAGVTTKTWSREQVLDPHDHDFESTNNQYQILQMRIYGDGRWLSAKGTKGMVFDLQTGRLVARPAILVPPAIVLPNDHLIYQTQDVPSFSKTMWRYLDFDPATGKAVVRFGYPVTAKTFGASIAQWMFGKRFISFEGPRFRIWDDFGVSDYHDVQLPAEAKIFGSISLEQVDVLESGKAVVIDFAGRIYLLQPFMQHPTCIGTAAESQPGDLIVGYVGFLPNGSFYSVANRIRKGSEPATSELKIWNGEGKLERAFPIGPDAPRSAAVSANGLIAIGSYNLIVPYAKVRIYDLSTGQLVKTLKLPYAPYGRKVRVESE